MRSTHFVCICFVLASAIALAQNPVPFVNQPVLPASTPPGGPGFTLTVNGTGFVSGATVNWNGSPRSTTFVNGTQLTTTVLASDIANPSTAIITVTNPTPGGGTSNYVYLSVTDPISPVGLVRTDFALGPVTQVGGIGSGFVVAGNLVTGDFNGDGKLDLVVGEGSGTLLGGGTYLTSSACVYLGMGNGTFQSPNCYSQSQGVGFFVAFPFLVTAADVNGDGKLDLVCISTVPFNPPSIAVFLGNGDGTFQTTAKTTSLPTTPAEIGGVGDFNNDGKLDVVIVGSPGITLLLGNGDGTFSPPSTISNNGSYAAIGDFNRDGNLDVAIADATGLQLFLGNGDGTFQAPQTISAITGPISAADVNNDGKLDLILQNDNPSPILSVLLGNGDGTFQAPSNTVDSDALLVTPVLGDMNGDGKLDFLGEQTTDLLSLQVGNGDGTFQAPVTFPVPGFPSVPAAALGDFNGDGKMDAAVFTVNSTLNTLNFSTFIQGMFPVAQLSTNSLNFAELPIGGTSSPQPVTLSNTGNTTMAISSIEITGADAADFSETNNCGTSLAANASCTINVTFTSKGGGALTASLAIADNASGSPQSVSITATSPDFSLAANTSPNATVNPGQTATYGINIVPASNFVGTVALTCTGAPPDSTCTIVPASVSVQDTAIATVTVSTTPPVGGITQNPAFPPYNGSEFLSLALFTFLLLSLGVRMTGWHREPHLLRRTSLLALFLIAGLATPSCGGGNSGGSGNSGGTPAGTYTLTVTGTVTSNSVTVTHNIKFTLTVK